MKLIERRIVDKFVSVRSRLYSPHELIKDMDDAIGSLESLLEEKKQKRRGRLPDPYDEPF